MAKIFGDNFKFFLFISSLFVNLYLVYLFYGGDAELTWTRKAARDAEDAASVQCSDHGRAFLDGIREGGKPVCECYGCFTGPDCSEFRPENCAVHADSGDPLFLERFWMQHEWGGAVMVSGWHRMGYLMGDNTLTSAELERHVRLLHSVIGNANTTGKYVVFGVGAMQLLNAAVHALSSSPNASASPARVVSTPPHYPAYRIQTNYFNGRSYVWKGATQQFLNESDPSARFVEFVTSPNNPTGELRDTHLKGPSASAIFDRVYYWPHFSAIPSPADDDLMIFSLGKVSGHAGSRFGWALVKDKGVYDRLSDYVGMNVLGVSHDTQLRALMVIKAILEGGGEKGRKLFEFGHKTLRNKWKKLNHVLSKSGRFSLQKLPSQYCTYFKTIREPSPGYAWVKCEREAEKECQGVLSAAGIIGNNGNWFGADTAHVRISLTKSEEEFDLMLDRFEQLVAEEKGGETVKLTNGAQTKQMKQVI